MPSNKEGSGLLQKFGGVLGAQVTARATLADLGSMSYRWVHSIRYHIQKPTRILISLFRLTKRLPFD
jgi:hypothetical protein